MMLVGVHLEQNRFEDAINALTDVQKALGENNPLRLITLKNLARMSVKLKKLAQVEQIYHQVIAILNCSSVVRQEYILAYNLEDTLIGVKRTHQ